MTLLATNGWRGSASTADIGGGITGRVSSIEGWLVSNANGFPGVGNYGSATTYGIYVRGSGFIQYAPVQPDGTNLIPGGAGFVCGFRIASSGSLRFKDHIGNTQVRIDGSTGNVYRGDGTTLLGTCSPATVWTGTITDSYVEVKLKVDSSAGYIIIHRNGVEVFNQSGINTSSTGTTEVEAINWDGVPSVADFYLCDLGGSHNNDFLGDVHIETLQATGDGHYQDFTPDSGADRYSLIREMRIPDNDASYVSSSTLNAKDTYTHEALQTATIAAIYGAVVKVVPERTDTPPRGMKTMMRSGTTDSIVSPEAFLPYGWNENPPTFGATGQTVSLAEGVFETDPATGVAWTASGINASEYGHTIST